MDQKERYGTPEIPPNVSTDQQRRLEVFHVRAQNRFFGKFLMEHRFGRLLVKYGLLNDPVMAEQEKNRRKISQLAEKLVDIGYVANTERALQEAQIEPDLSLPDPDWDYLMQKVEQSIMSRLAQGTFGDVEPNLAKYLDIDQKVEGDITSISDLTRAKIYLQILPQVIQVSIYADLRDRFIQSIYSGQWEALVDLLYFNFREEKLSAHLDQLLNRFKHVIFTNRQFRSYLIYRMVIILCRYGQNSFDQFNEYLANFGLDITDTQEKKTFLNAVNTSNLIDQKWEWNSGDRNEYFQVLYTLFQCDLLPQGYLSQPIFLCRVYEYVLLAFYGHENRHFLVELRRMLTEFGLCQDLEMTLINQHQIYNQYAQSCYQLGLMQDPRVYDIFKRRRSSNDED